MTRPRTFRELKASGYRPRSVRDEMRDNMIARLRRGGPMFDGVVGYEHTVEPQIANAVLSRHDFILLGLRGQAKTRLLRSLVQFLDEWVPAIEGCPLNSDPFHPLTHHAKVALETHGDDLSLVWLHRDHPGATPRLLADAISAGPWLPGRVGVFAHGERESMKAVRAVVKPRLTDDDQLSLSGYWAYGRTEDVFQAEKREPIGQLGG